MKVFLSSTAQDLAAYRRVADDTILRLALQSVVMERFGPLPDTPVEECERLAGESDVVICIVAHRYGYVPEKGRGSITRREVEAAYKAGKDVLVWIVDDNYPWTEKKEQDLLADPSVVANPAKVAEVAEGVSGLLDFKAWLRKTFTPETFTTPDDLGKKIALALPNYIYGRTAPPISQNTISIAQLPTSSAELFGRENELELLDNAWANPNTNIVSFVAWGGVGKTALINHWLKRRMARDNYRGAERVYGWSFFSQGTDEHAASTDLFIDQALRWFGDSDTSAGSAWDKGERLARYIRHYRTLLILDGLEPLQHPPGSEEGKLKDTALHTLLVELAAQQSGLCIVSTRVRVGDLVEFEGSTVVQHNLEQLSPQAGAQILRSLNVQGDDQELEKAAIELSGHAFSLTLLGSYLDEVLNGDIRRRDEIENLFDDARYGDATQRMIAAYEKWLGQGIELAILRLLGLFEHPADPASIKALLKPPAIERLTEPLQRLKVAKWNQAVTRLRRIKLLSAASPDEPGTLDAHPIVREYFKQQLKGEYPEAWREANNRLFEHLTAVSKEYPETVEEMSPLYAAVAHACAAGRFSEALDDVYWRRIGRRNHFNRWHLGSFGADLSALSSFFVTPWTVPYALLTDDDKAAVMVHAGGDLRALGRLQESIEPVLAAMEMLAEKKNWEPAANVANNLTQVYMTIGALSMALEMSHKNVEYADLSGTVKQKALSLVVMASVYLQMGELEKSAELFNEAEKQVVQAGEANGLPIFNGPISFNYCDLLLDQGRIKEAKDRATKALIDSPREYPPLYIGVDSLTLARVRFFEGEFTSPDDIGRQATLLNQSVEALRLAGQVEFVPLGLLSRGMFYRLIVNFDLAERDLAEAKRIAMRSDMGLHLADYNLEYARLQLAQNNIDKAREHLVTAKEMIERMGYRRRDKQVADVEAQLG